MAWCCLCGKEGWSVSHFYSEVHLKNVHSHPLTWEPTWKMPNQHYSSVADFEVGPQSFTAQQLWDLDDSHTDLVSWAATHLKLHKKPTVKRDYALTGKGDDALTGKILEKAELMWSKEICKLATHIDDQTEQMEIQVNFMVCLEKQIVDQEEMMKARERQLWLKNNELMEGQGIMQKKILHLEEVIETLQPKIKEVVLQPDAGCFSWMFKKLFTWCR